MEGIGDRELTFLGKQKSIMKTKELIAEIQKLPLEKRIYVIERTMHLMRKHEENRQMKKAADAL